MKEEMADFWNELTSEQKQEIKTAQNQIKKGESTDYESFPPRPFYKNLL